MLQKHYVNGRMPPRRIGPSCCIALVLVPIVLSTSANASNGTHERYTVAQSSASGPPPATTAPGQGSGHPKSLTPDEIEAARKTAKPAERFAPPPASGPTSTLPPIASPPIGGNVRGQPGSPPLIPSPQAGSPPVDQMRDTLGKSKP